MRQFYRKRFPALLLALVMVMTMVPAVSARTSADFTYEVDKGESVEFTKTDFRAVYREEYSGKTPYYVVFTDYEGLDDYGSLSAVDYDGDTVTLDESDLDSAWFYYKSSDVPDDMDYELNGLTFEAKRRADSGTLRLKFRAYGESDEYVSGIMDIEIGTSGSSSSTITYEVEAGEGVKLDASDFETFYEDNCSGGTFRYVTFDRPSSSDYADGYLYYRYGKSDETYFPRSELEDYSFYDSDDSYGDYELDKLSFQADDDFEGPVELSFTVHGSGSRSASGTLKIIAVGTSTSARGDITYEVEAGEDVAFDADDFAAYYEDNCSGTFKYVIFDRPSSSDYADGYLYDRYGKRSETKFGRSDLSGVIFYDSDSDYDYGDEDYDLDDLSFVADDDFKGPVKLSFTVYGGTGSRTNKSTTGTLVITATGKSTTIKGDISYTVKAGDEVELDADDFASFYSAKCTGTFKYVIFDRPSSSDYADGYLYDRYGKRSETKFGRSDLSGIIFYDSDSEYDYASEDYDLDDLSFVADDDFKGPVKLSFTVYGGSGDRTNRSAVGTLVIQTGSTARYTGDIRYSTTPNTAVQINANDIARYFRKQTGDTLRYLLLTGVPSTGGLYYNYYGASKYGAATRTQLTSTSAAGRVFSYSPSATSEYALSELTYVPNGNNYCTALSFAAYGGSGTSATGTILISVTTAAVAEVYAVTSRGTSVNFPVSAVYSAVSTATGSGLSGIQFLALPDSSAGTLYCGSSRAGTANVYNYTGSTASMSQLRFVPNSGFTGSVTLPYVALNSRGTAIAAGQVSIGVVSSVKKFSDITTSTWCYKYVTELASAGIISGYSNGSYQEKNTITYGAALKLIMLAAGYSEQAPTVKNSTFSGYLAKAKADGLVSGDPNLSGSITRLQVAQIAAKAMKLSTANLSNKKPFTDTSDVYVQALNAAGIIEGYFSNGSSTYKPNNTLTRGQVSAIVWRMRNYNR